MSWFAPELVVEVSMTGSLTRVSYQPSKGNTVASDKRFVQAEVADLSRRMGVLEEMIHGRAQHPPHPALLVSLYMDAARGPVFDDVSARHWERQVYLLDARTLLITARLTRDPLPWQPYLYLLDRYVEAGFSLEPVREHLLSVSQDLLNIQGFGKITPRDCMRNPLRIKVALAAISRRGDHAEGEAGTGQDP